MNVYRQPLPVNPHFPRYSKEALPPYRFIPGLSPHPRRDVDGHSYNQTEEKPAFINPQDWQLNHHYLLGVDLYNQAYWWESHEAWETIWHTTDKNSEYGQYLQGLIQISAAFIKWFLRQQDGLEKLFGIGFSRLQSVEKTQAIYMGHDLTAFLEKIKKHFEPVLQDKNYWPDPLTDYPFIVLTR